MPSRYWIYLAGGILLWMAFALDMGPDVGWFAYVPLSGPQYGAGKRADIWAQMITFTEVSALAVAVEIVVTVFKQRAPGMSLDRIPLFVWAMLVTSFMVIFAMPAIMVASTLLILDRLVGTHFFNPAEGGDVLLWQHLFWFFGHPEVYIIFLPAVGMVSTIVATFARRPMFGYLPLVLSLIATGILAFGLWVHHMFATGLPRLGESFFTASSMMIAIPAGVQIFCWLATFWVGRPVLRDAAAVRPRLHRHLRHRRPDRRDGGVGAVRHAGARHLFRRRAFPLRADRRRGVPVVRRDLLLVSQDHRPDDERDARPLEFLAGLRRLQPHLLSRCISSVCGDAAAHLHLPAGDGLGTAEPVRQPERGDVGAQASLLFFVDAIRSAAARPPAPATIRGMRRHLEWATASPPPRYNFARIPVVASREPLWDEPDSAAGGDRAARRPPRTASSARWSRRGPRRAKLRPRTRSGHCWRPSRPV